MSQAIEMISYDIKAASLATSLSERSISEAIKRCELKAELINGKWNITKDNLRKWRFSFCPKDDR